LYELVLKPVHKIYLQSAPSHGATTSDVVEMEGFEPSSEKAWLHTSTSLSCWLI